MKTMKILKQFALLSIFPFVLVACSEQSKSDKVKEEATEAVEATKDFFSSEKKTTIEKMESKLDDIDDQIEDAADETQDKLREAQIGLQAEISKIKVASKDNWNDLKKNSKEFMDNMEADLGDDN
ncbi:MAG: Mg2+ and Co2+ transporter CorA [Sphingobacteriales bacterium]|jgi:Mg2+ and Co2+ transporter CorA